MPPDLFFYASGSFAESDYPITRGLSKQRSRSTRSEFWGPRSFETFTPIAYFDKTPGSIWIEGEELHWVDSNRDEWAITGALIGPEPTAFPGSFWLHPVLADLYAIHYVDDSGSNNVRRVALSTTSDTTDYTGMSVVIGSLWVGGVENEFKLSVMLPLSGGQIRQQKISGSPIFIGKN